MKQIVLLMLVLAVMALGSACNTMEGIGRDVEETGEGIGDALD